MLPQIVFGEVNDDYFPGPDFWQTESLSISPNDVLTSGICQPPLHATVVRHMLETVDDRKQAQEFAAEIFPKLKAWHDFLYRERDPEDEGLVYIRHPWSSGQDNSPNWEHALEKMDLSKDQIPDYERKDTKHPDSKDRPSDKSYDRYVYLVDFFRKRNYDEEKIRKDGCPFMVQDVLFNTLLCRAGRDLAQIAEWLGENPAHFQKQFDKTAHRMNEKLWNEQEKIYTDYDVRNDEPIDTHMLSGFLPLFADIPSPVQAEKIFDYLNTKSFSKLESDRLAVPSFDRQEPEYSSEKYWRGPIWINMNWLLYKGLARYGHANYDQKIKETIVDLTKKHGFHEYYNPEDGEGYGASDFSWTAALLIDILKSEKVSKIT